MKVKQLFVFILGVIISAYFLTGCRDKKPVAGGKSIHLKILVNETYCKATACKCIQYLASREYKDVAGILKIKHNIDLELTYCMEEDSIGILLKTGKFDGVICKPWFALSLMPETGMEFKRIVDIADPFGGSKVKGIFIVRNESTIKTQQDLNGVKVAIGREDSYEKYHLAMKALDERQIVPSQIIQKGTCTESLNMLIDHQADAACISDYALFASCAVDFAGEDSFRTIFTTDSIPLCSVMIDLSRVNENTAKQLQAALLKVSENIPANFGSKGFVNAAPWTPVPYKGNNTR